MSHSRRVLDDVYEAGRAFGHNEGFSEGMRSAQDAILHAPKNPLAMQPQDGDVVIRKMGNGYVIVTITTHGMVSAPQVVEGDMVEVGKQLIAIEAAKTMQNNAIMAQIPAALTTGQYVATTSKWDALQNRNTSLLGQP